MSRPRHWEQDMIYPFVGTIKTKLTTDAEGKPMMTWREVKEPTEVMRITRDGIWVKPGMKVDEAAQAVLAALADNIKTLVAKAREEDEALLRRALEAMQSVNHANYSWACVEAIAALRGRLGEMK